MSLRILVIDPKCVSLDWCLRAQNDGHQVKLWSRNEEKTKYIGLGLVEKVPEWQKWALWSDFIFIADNTHWLRDIDGYRARGVPVFGPTNDLADLELDRSKGQDVLKKHGIAIPVSRTFNDYDRAIAFVKKEMRRFVSKPSGDADKALSYVAKSPADLVYMLERWKKLAKLKGAFLLQDFIEGVEMAVGAFFGPHGFSEGWCENWEFKKLMNGDCGPNTGEQGTVLRFVKQSKLAAKVLKPLEDYLIKQGYVGYIDVNCMIDAKGTPWPLEFTCYDDQTDVLTADGWKRFKDVSLGESVATLNPATGGAEYQPALNVIKRSYVGELIHFTAASYGVDLCVTPDHAMWARDQHKAAYEFVSAERAARGGSWQIQRAAPFTGPEVETFVLPQYVEHHWLGRHNKAHKIIHAAKAIPMDAWLRFLGLYISEGSLGKNGYIVGIAQGAKKKALVREALRGLPFDVQETAGGFQICSVQLGSWIKENAPGLCNTKRVPRQFMALSARQCGVLLDALMLGDGSTHKRTGGRVYYSSSPGLADDVSELITRMGNLARISVRKQAGTRMTINGSTHVRRYDSYVVNEVTEKKTGWLDRRQVKRIPYAGTVYCLNVPPHHLLYVRRNGKAAWCGNCRPGWPTFNIQQALHQGDSAQWMMDTIKGKDPKCWRFDETALGVVITIPDYPYSHLTRKEVVGIPIYGIKPSIVSALHPCEVMIGKAPMERAGKIVDETMYVTAGDYIMVCSATAPTIEKAKEKAYRIVKCIKLPNSPMYRTDIGNRLKKQLPQLQKLGYAQGTVWSEASS